MRSVLGLLSLNFVRNLAISSVLFDIDTTEVRLEGTNRHLFREGFMAVIRLDPALQHWGGRLATTATGRSSISTR